MTDFGIFQTAHLPMQKVLEMAMAVALTPTPILISGEQGTGKTLMVQFVLERARFQKTLHKWGRDLGEIKDGDVILIDGLDELNLMHQQELSEKIDSLRSENRRIRWIATASVNPSQLVQEQRLRKDLFYRLSVIHLQIPALRERNEDTLILADFFSQVFNLMKSRSPQKISAQAQAKLLSHDWSGNISELENVMERAVALSCEGEIQVSAIQFSQTETQLHPSAGSTLSEMERKLILQTLQLTQQNKTRAAQILGISIRTLRNKLHEYREAGVS